MELATIIFGCVIIIVLSIFILNNTKRTYNKGVNIFNKGDLEGASEIFLSILKKHEDAPLKLAECRLKQAIYLLEKNTTNAQIYLDQIIKIGQVIPELKYNSIYKELKERALYSKAKINLLMLLKENDLDNKIKWLHENISFIKCYQAKYTWKETNVLLNKHNTELYKSYFDKGINEERKNNYYEAITNYMISLEYISDSDIQLLRSNVLTRIGISRLKNKESPEEYFLEKARNASVNYRNDFFYRYTIHLYSKNKIEKANEIISLYLNNNEEPAVRALKKFLNKNQNKYLIDQIEIINRTIDQLYDNKYDVNFLRDVYNNLDSIADALEQTNKATADQIRNLKPSFFNRVLSNYISAHAYLDAIRFIENFPNFWMFSELLKNLGICCYFVVTQGLISEDNYPEIISGWLTSIYSVDIFINSLKSTSWDDDYTFTLINSKASKYKCNTNLPKNINMEPENESNISIGKVQAEILNNFEIELKQKVADLDLDEDIIFFYEDEKECLEKIQSLCKKNVFLAAPSFAVRNGINETILKELEDEYTIKGDEELLEIGSSFLGNTPMGIFKEYAEICELIDSIRSALLWGEISRLEYLVIEARDKNLRNYKKSINSLEEIIIELLSNKINNQSDPEILFTLFDLSIEIIESERLKYKYSNYIQKYYTKLKNSSILYHYEALKLLHRAYLHSPAHFLICKDIVAEVDINLIDLFHNINLRYRTQIFDIIDNLLKNKSDNLIECCKTLSKHKSKIENDLFNIGVDVTRLNGNRKSEELSDNIQLKIDIYNYYEKLLVEN